MCVVFVFSYLLNKAYPYYICHREGENIFIAEFNPFIGLLETQCTLKNVTNPHGVPERLIFAYGSLT